MSATTDVPRLSEAVHARSSLRERCAKPREDRTGMIDADARLAVSADAAEAGGLE